MQAVNHLLAWGFGFIRVNHKNSEGKTAWDIFKGQTQVDNREIKILLRNAGASSGSSLSAVTRSNYNDIDEFYNLIGEDVKLLEHIDELPFVNTPLHIAASVGNIQFAKEMIGLKPSFARKLNQNGFSPIHVALQNGQIELVRRLLQFDGDLVRVKGREHITPLHYVVANGDNLDLLDKFLLVCPNSITDVMVRNETALHIALKYDNLEAFKFLMGWLERNYSKNFNEKVVLNWKDNEGNTAVRHLLAWSSRFVVVNHKNIEGQTAWDILQGQTQEVDNREIRVMLHRAGADSGVSLSTFKWHPMEWLPIPNRSTLSSLYIKSELRSLSEEKRSMLLVVAVLLVTIGFQAVLSPPGGVWQDNGQCINTTKVGSSHNGTNDQTPFNTTVGSSNDPVTIHLTRSNTTLVCEHKAGTAIALKDGIFWLFLICNSLIVGISNSLIVLAVLNERMKFLFLGLNLTLCFSYFCSVRAIIDDKFLAFCLAYLSAIFSVLAVLLDTNDQTQ
ncbi:ankyrin repeat-containing protein bda1 [Quercus suber]|uniref:Ankyrin repeat-containing protein bda1 n=1 Tax=Quercus suber TaxID=58331 RepID=A0AAW0M2F3_QUESU